MNLGEWARERAMTLTNGALALALAALPQAVLAQEAAQSTGSSTPMGSLALQLYRLMIKQGKGKLDFSAVQKLFVE